VQGVLPSTTNYASNISYAPHGAVMGLQLGNGLWETTNFNSRLQPVTMYLGSMQGGSDVWKLLNTYGTSGQNNGNVTLQQLSLPAPSPGGNPVTVTSAYTYDGVNRLLVAAENPANQTSPVCPDAASQWCTQFGYDVYGNRSIAGRTNFGVSPNEPAAFNAANQITGTGWTYDTVNLRGTITGDPAGDLFAYDAEDRLLSGNGISYLYDGDGRRVGKAPAGGAANPTWYVYDAMGNLAAEYNAPPAEAGTVYLTGDQLGSTRVVTNTVTPGTPSERHDYYPFGEEILTTTASPRYGIAGYAPAVEMPWLFTGKERDSESGLDYFGARYYGSSMGRFMSPDPVFATVNRLMDPQQWNMYSYAGNNPLSNTDPTGLDFNITGCGSTNTTNCSNGTFGTYDSKGQFTATVLSNDANGGLVDKAGNSYSGTFDQSGFHFSNADGSVSGGGQYVDPGTTTTLNGSGVFSGTQGAFNSDCGGSCQGKGSLTDIVPGSIQAAKDAFGLSKEDAFNIFGGHGDALNYRGPDDQDAHIVQHLNTTGKNAGKTELHFEGHPPGRDLVNFVLHQVDAIRDAHNHQSQKEPDLP
jgi:RHS repeat-associated protein